MVFDLVADNVVGLQIPLQATRSVEPPLIEEDECLETKTNIVFDGSLQRNKFDLQCQFTNLHLVVTDNFFSHEILISDFDEPIGVDGYVSLIPHDDVVAITEFFLFVFNQSSLADFGDLAMCESVTDGLPTCHWFDTGHHFSPFIPFVFRLTKYGHHVSVTEFDKNGYRPIIRAQGSSILIFAIRCSSYYSSGDNSKIAWEGASHNWFLKMSRYILAMESACKVFNVMSTSLLVRVLAETPKETECLLISFGGQESIMSAAHSTHALPRRYFDVNSLYSVLSRQKIDLVASNNIYVDIIFMKSTILEDVSKREIQSNEVRNDVKNVKFNEGIRHDECLFPVDPGENLFMVKLGGTVKVNCVWDPGISSKIMHRNGLMETIDTHLLLEFIVTISLLFNYFYDAHLKGNTQSTKKRKMTAIRLSVFPYFWLSLSQDNGWQVLVDVCALGVKNMPTLSVKPSSQIESLGAWGDKNLIVEGIMEYQNVSTD
ncbi:hypothetical protein R3W88_001652 [Solanum pinnatisectum]|uniref:Uncharacterized protein n=1 Tax=Solanum pinnatisectum TaxID=50273 RepID=A0AAV9MLL8_9SOLN|nr:hypothetical protein R3W88_001652 [Solanum pinnatisectum]